MPVAENIHFLLTGPSDRLGVEVIGLALKGILGTSCGALETGQDGSIYTKETMRLFFLLESKLFSISQHTIALTLTCACATSLPSHFPIIMSRTQQEVKQ